MKLSLSSHTLKQFLETQNALLKLCLGFCQFKLKLI